MKNLEALGAGSALVTTTLGARGLDLTDGREALIADGADAFAGAVARVLSDPLLALRIGAAGREHVSRRFGHDAAAEFNLDLWNQLASG